MVKRHSAVRRRGLTAYKIHELLMGVIQYPNVGYTGYGNVLADQYHDSLTANYISDEMRQDWEENRDALMAFWRSGKIAVDLREYGFNFYMKPWLWVVGSRNTLPWAAKVFDRDGLARRAQRRREAAGEGRQRS